MRIPWKEDKTSNGFLFLWSHSYPAAQLTTSLSQPSVDDSGHQDVPCHLVALDGSSLERESSGIRLLPNMTIFLVASLNKALVWSEEGIYTNQGHQKDKAIHSTLAYQSPYPTT